MTQHYQNRTIEGAVEQLKLNGFDALADAVAVLMNSAMVAERTDYLGVEPYERSVNRVSYANGYKDKALKTRLGTLSLKVPQTRDIKFYPQSLERGLRSERALLLAIAEMYVQGVSTRRVKKIVEELCGLEISSTQVSRAAAELDELLGLIVRSGSSLAGLPLLGNETKSHFDSLAKKAFAFFRISRSIRSCRFSAFKRRNSICSGVSLPLPWKAPSDSAASIFQRPSILG